VVLGFQIALPDTIGDQVMLAAGTSAEVMVGAAV